MISYIIYFVSTARKKSYNFQSATYKNAFNTKITKVNQSGSKANRDSSSNNTYVEKTCNKRKHENIPTDGFCDIHPTSIYNFYFDNIY